MKEIRVPDKPAGRFMEKTIEVKAPVDEVWRALTEADRLSRWFTTHAEVHDPGVGGRIVLSWGPDFTGTTRIDIWEPLRHLRTVDDRSQRQVSEVSAELGRDAAAQPTAHTPLTVDFYLESRGETTTLRIVHSGFGDSEEWDREYDAIFRGWGLFLLTLRHYLERHPQDACHHTWVQEMFPTSRTIAWDRMVGVRGLCAVGSLRNLRHGDPFNITAVNGWELAGTIDHCRGPEDLAFTLSTQGDSLFRISLFDVGPGQGAYGLTLLAYGMEDDQFADWTSRWRTLLNSIFA